MTDIFGSKAKLPPLPRVVKPELPPPPAEDVAELIAQAAALDNKVERRIVGNSTDMGRVKELLRNAVTAAHDDAGKALDKVLEEATELLARITKKVEEHKKALQDEGQRIAHDLESAVQELKRTVEWVEKQGPALRNPKLEQKEAE